MSKLVRAIIFSAYTALLIQYLKITINRISKDSIEIEYVFRAPINTKKLHKEMKKSGFNHTYQKLKNNYRKTERMPTDFKYVLKWTDAFSHYSASMFGNGQTVFIKNNCKYQNCYLTSDRQLLPDIRYYDAILFDVENSWDEYPIFREPHQRYIFTASEPASRYPVCSPSLDSFYNFTWTYKLDSNIRWSYITVMDKKGNVVGPAINMTWLDSMKPITQNVASRLIQKKKAVAWFVSNCNTMSKREKLGAKLSAALDAYNMKVDIFGWCGQLTCPKDRNEECLDTLEEEYFFYLAFENSLCPDYVTEKLLYPLQHFTVPIVYGGANYTRFLPPGSYLNAGEQNAKELAFQMNRAIKNHTIYIDYFRWHNHYEYKNPPVKADVCELCRILNTPTQSLVKDLRKWWNIDTEEDCKHYKELKPPY